MKTLKINKRKEKYITNENGKKEYVILPINYYNKLTELIEDFGLGLAIKEAENSKKYSRKDIYKFFPNI